MEKKRILQMDLHKRIQWIFKWINGLEKEKRKVVPLPQNPVPF
jgi:hypothetical protein